MESINYIEEPITDQQEGQPTHSKKRLNENLKMAASSFAGAAAAIGASMIISGSGSEPTKPEPETPPPPLTKPNPVPQPITITITEVTPEPVVIVIDSPAFISEAVMVNPEVDSFIEPNPTPAPVIDEELIEVHQVFAGIEVEIPDNSEYLF